LSGSARNLRLWPTMIRKVIDGSRTLWCGRLSTSNRRNIVNTGSADGYTFRLSPDPSQVLPSQYGATQRVDSYEHHARHAFSNDLSHETAIHGLRRPSECRFRISYRTSIRR
jgi:hypothetical protein